MADAGCTEFIVHARIAILSGLSPKQNREVPPLNYPRVHRLAQAYPALRLEINGGFRDIEGIRVQRDCVDGVMIGRAAYQTPFFLAEVEHALVPGAALPTRFAIMHRLAEYAREQQAAGIPLRAIARHTLGLFQSLPGARRYRRTLSEGMHQPDADVDLLERALDELQSLSA